MKILLIPKMLRYWPYRKLILCYFLIVTFVLFSEHVDFLSVRENVNSLRTFLTLNFRVLQASEDKHDGCSKGYPQSTGSITHCQEVFAFLRRVNPKYILRELDSKNLRASYLQVAELIFSNKKQ